ncbi:MAG: NAD(P)/FAD-dependent oxidoreductase [Proteobacteria bacterium]|nr:NAD(P)/FAD-dependent oxidoreductase [Pseudomonadota bacterium]
MRLDVIVIGAGAAGMMCAAQAAARGRGVLLIEHAAKVGERIRISGGGRCNFTNRSVGPGNFLSQNPHFCRSALARFSARDFIAMVERRGIRYHEKTLGQLFCDDSSAEIIAMLRAACDEAGVRWAHPCAVQSVGRAGPGGPRFAVATDRGTFQCDSLVVATGGLALPQIGATPFGYKLAEQFGLGIVPPKPALVPLALAPEVLLRLKTLSGLSIDAVTRCVPGQPVFREGVLVTHRGLSGPAILQISTYWQAQADPKRPIQVDLLPSTEARAWLAGHRHSKALLATLLAERLPRRFAQEWCAMHGWERPLNEMSSKEVEAAGSALKGWTLAPSGTLGYAKAEVTLGGIDTAGLSSKTMEAVAVPGLYFIGEVVDVTGWLGGYNFQWAWSSGWVAGQYA